MTDLRTRRVQREILAVAKPGEVVFLKLADPMATIERDCMVDGLIKFSNRYGIGIVILDGRLEVARIKAPSGRLQVPYPVCAFPGCKHIAESGEDYCGHHVPPPTRPAA